MGEPLTAYIAPSSVRLYSSRPRFIMMASVDLPPDGGPSNSSSRRPTSEPAAAPLKVTTAQGEYALRLQARRASLHRQNWLELRTADARLIVFTLGLVLLTIALVYGSIGWGWSLVPFGVYVALLVVHERPRLGIALICERGYSHNHRHCLSQLAHSSPLSLDCLLH